MRCDKARERFSPWLDGELAPVEMEALRQHLASCPDCRAELEDWQAISASLKGLARSYTAPAGFSASVISQLQPTGRQRSRTSFRRWAASAAAAVILATSSAGLAYHYLNTPAPPAINDPGPSTTASIEPVTSPAPVQPDNQGTTGTVAPSTQTDVTPPGTDADQTPAAPSEPVKIAQNTVEPKTFLSTEKVITTTMMKLGVKDPGSAFSLAKALGQTYSASTQVLAQQTDQKYVVKYVVPVDKEAGLMACLSHLGTTRDQSTDKQDVTAVYAETLETYRETVSQLNAATDEDQQKELADRVKYLEDLLSSWDKEAEKRMIVLCLES